MMQGISQQMSARLRYTPRPSVNQRHEFADHIDALAARIVELEAMQRNIVSHATGGGTTGAGMSLNNIGVRITAFRNTIYSAAYSTALREVRAIAERYDDKAKCMSCADTADILSEITALINKGPEA